MFVIFSECINVGLSCECLWLTLMWRSWTAVKLWWSRGCKVGCFVGPQSSGSFASRRSCQAESETQTWYLSWRQIRLNSVILHDKYSEQTEFTHWDKMQSLLNQNPIIIIKSNNWYDAPGAVCFKCVCFVVWNKICNIDPLIHLSFFKLVHLLSSGLLCSFLLSLSPNVPSWAVKTFECVFNQMSSDCRLVVLKLVSLSAVDSLDSSRDGSNCSTSLSSRRWSVRKDEGSLWSWTHHDDEETQHPRYTTPPSLLKLPAKVLLQPCRSTCSYIKILRSPVSF